MLPTQPARELSAPTPVLAPPRPGEPLGLIAGGGTLPHTLADMAFEAGWRPVVVSIADGIAERWSGHSPTAFRWGRTGDIFAHFGREGVRHAVFCGTVSVRPDYRSIIPSFRTLALLPEILRITRGGDDVLLRAVANAFERRGFTLHAVHEFVPQLLTPQGSLTPHQPTAEDFAALGRAFQAARWLGQADVGQAVVASRDRVIALEAIEGTSGMLERVADLRRRGRLGRKERCVLVKSVKPQQDLRFDLPSIGVRTIRQAREAGLSGIGLTAGTSLLIGVEEIVSESNAAGIFVYGLGEDTL